MSTTVPVCWQDRRLVFGPLNSVYQNLRDYSDIVELWSAFPENEEGYYWLGQEGFSALVMQSQITQPAEGCYNLTIQSGIFGYPETIYLK